MTQPNAISNTLAPVVLFVYNRPDHTRRTLEALSANDLAGDTVLYIYADGPKPFASDDERARIAQVRAVVRSRRWCGEMRMVESDWNRGLADNIVRGVTEVIERHGRVIVLEDDIVTRPGFLRFMNEALELYESDPRVMHISGMIFGTPRTPGAPTAFLRILSCNGWATWKRAWVHYSGDADLLANRLKEQGISSRKFDIEGHATFYRQLQKNRDGTLATWAVKWYASWLTAGGYSLFPRRSLLTNIGHDDSGAHDSAAFLNGETVDALSPEPIPVKEDLALRREVDGIWQEGLRSKRARQRINVRRWSATVLAPVQSAGRRLLRFFYPELYSLDMPTASRIGLVSTAFNSRISPKAKLHPPYHVNSSTVGDYTYIMPNNWISMTQIGKFCSIGPGLACGAGVHPTEGISTSPMFYSAKKQNGVTLSPYDKVVERKPVTIGNDVFIGMNVTILDGVSIGDGAVVGAGCVVSKDVPPYAIVVGSPMRIIRERFPKEIIEKMLKIKWWDWPDDRLREVEQSFFDVQQFVERHAGKDSV